MSVTGPSALRGSPWASQANGTSHHRALPMEKHGVPVWGGGGTLGTVPSLSHDNSHLLFSPFLLQGEPGPPGDPGLTVGVS